MATKTVSFNDKICPNNDGEILCTLSQLNHYHTLFRRGINFRLALGKNGERLPQTVFGISQTTFRYVEDSSDMWSSSDDKERAVNEALEEEKEDILDILGNVITPGNVSHSSIKSPSSDEFRNAQYILEEKENKEKEEENKNKYLV